MGEWFEFSPVDRVQRLLRFRLTGFWGSEQLRAFESEFRGRVEEASADGEGFYVLVDLSECPPQNEEVQDGHKRCMGYAIERGMVKSAHLVDAALTDMQMRRLADSVDGLRFAHFRSEKDALRWLFE